MVVEIDGYRGHRSPAQLRADHQRDLELRRAGYVVLRYTWDQLTDAPEAVARRHRAATSDARASAYSSSPASFERSRSTALVCSWDTRDSVTPRTSPISRRVRFS